MNLCLRPNGLLRPGLAPAALLGTMLLATACGGGGDSPSPPSAPAPSPGETPPPAPTPGSAQATPAGTPQGIAASAHIGAGGGSLSSIDGRVQLTVPPGAFAQSTQVTIQPITNTAHGGQGRAYRITPEGLHSAAPMTLAIEVNEALVQGSALAAMSIATQDADGRWHAYRKPVRDTAARTLTVQTTHFSDWAVVAGAQLRPGRAAVPRSQTLDLTVVTCRPLDDGNGGTTATLDACTEEPRAEGELADWAVNGIPGGTAGAGYIKEIPLASPQPYQIPHRARFEAPPVVPAANPVAVSVRHIPAWNPAESVTLVSNVLVTEQHGCQWMRNADWLHFEMEMEYAYSGPGPEGPTSLTQAGRVTDKLQSVQQNDFQGAWMGVSTKGSAHLDDRIAKDPEGVRLSGNGLPAIGSGIDADQSTGAQLVVNYGDCTYHFGGRIGVLASSGKPNDPPRVTEVGNFRLNGFKPIDPVNGIFDFAEMPRVESADAIGTYTPGGLGHGITGGKAMVRWWIHRFAD